VALKPLKAPKAPAWKTYKPARPNYAPPKKFTTPGGPAPQGYAKYGIGTPAPWGQSMAAAPPKQPQYKMFDWSTVAGGGDFSGNAAAFQQPDYGAMIGGDWEVQDAEAAMGAQMARARGDFQAGLRSQLIDLGLSDTSKLGSLGQYIDADTIKAAVENKYSATAQIGQQAERGRAQNNAALAARGLLSSGQTTKSEQDVSAAAESGRYSALRSFLEGGASGLSGLADLEYNMARGVAQARQAAAMRAAELAQWNSQFGGEGEAGANGTLFAPNASAGIGAIPLNLGFNPNYRRPVMMTRQQFAAKKPQGVYGNYTRAWNRQHPFGY
jgi:hypothetical protein